MIPRTRYRVLAGLLSLPFLLLAMGLALPASAEDAAAPTPEAKLNELTAEYTIRYQFSGAAQAIPVAQQALAVAEEAFGPDHERVAQVLNDLGHLHQAQHELEQAGQLHERALKIRERVFNSDGPAVVQSLVNLAKVHTARKRYTEAQPLFERALAIAERHVPPTDPFLIGALEPYADVLRRRRNTKAAKAVQDRIKEIRAAQREKAGQGTSINDVLR
ncbi:MAG: tetratricopeptide repeat protein [Candidatus Omnitrophica bacterium]|nr:tetratricopeptide repeat protein [Candidatus Omnitrophota bacterium]